MSFSLCCSQSCRLAQRLTNTQRLALATSELQLRRDLVEAIHGEQYTPRATCPKCEHALTDLEIMRGFNDNPRDYTTGCPKCQHRFLARLYRSTNGIKVEMAYFCPMQTLDQMGDLVNVPLDTFRTTHAAVYNSAVVHFGGIRQAFTKLGVTYIHQVDPNWKEQVGPFLGKMADTVIAELVGVTTYAVRKLRKEMYIDVYSRREAADSMS
ncbi:MAG: hypothetical protein NUV56_03140 [Candidatus Uhrbacteria bacterium]|nr:hypothetical protein [Candidatus Uhrbacteria bacterium]